MHITGTITMSGRLYHMWIAGIIAKDGRLYHTQIMGIMTGHIQGFSLYTDHRRHYHVRVGINIRRSWELLLHTGGITVRRLWEASPFVDRGTYHRMWKALTYKHNVDC